MATKMRIDFKNKPKNKLTKIFVAVKLPYNLVIQMANYHPKSGRSKFIELAVIERMANLDAIKQAKEMKGFK